MKAIPVGRTGVGTLYFVMDGESTGFVIEKNKKTHNVDFLSFIARKPVKRIMSSEFHEFLWTGVDSPNDKWRNIIEARVQSIPDSMIAGVDFLDKIPKADKKSHIAGTVEKDERATEFKSLLASGNNEKALGRALSRSVRWGGRQATGGIRGFVRGSTFNPNAEDADGDGFVQEGTQFARRVTGSVAQGANRQVRRAKKVRRAQERISDRQRFGLRARRNYLPKTPRERWVQRSREHYRKIFEEDTKRVLDQFHGGKPIKTYKDLNSAMQLAHPGFLNKTSKADYLQLDDNDDVSPAHYEHAIGFMLALSWNSRLSEQRFDIASSDKRIGYPSNFDGATGFMGRQHVENTPNGVDFKPSKEKPTMKFDLTYVEKTSYDIKTDLGQFGDFQLETNKMFFTMLNEVDSDTPIDEANKLWAEARRMAARNITIHEMGHAAHHSSSMDDALRSVGLGVDGDLTMIDLVRRVDDHIRDGMSDKEVGRALREVLVDREYREGFVRTLSVIARLKQMDPVLGDQLSFRPIEKWDGSGPISVSKGLAVLLNGVGKDIFPNLTGHRWKEGDPIHWDIVEALFDLPSRNAPLFSDQEHLYTQLFPWNGRMVAPMVDSNHGPVAVPNLALILEHGLPETRLTPAVSAEDAKPIVEAIMRMSDVSKQLINGRTGPDYLTRRLRVPQTGGKVTPANLLDTELGFIDARELLLKEAMQEIEQIHELIRKGLAGFGDARLVWEHLFSTTKRFDDLTPGEREIVRAIAKLGSQGQWASYMSEHISQGLDTLFNFHDMELFAEIAAANGVGNEIFLRWGNGTRSLNDVEKAVVAKVHKWLFPDAPIRIK